MYCHVTKKRSFDSEEIALEALLQNHIVNFHSTGNGPRNIYECDHCGSWHFTSKSEDHPELHSDKFQNRLKRERLGVHWERKLR